MQAGYFRLRQHLGVFPWSRRLRSPARGKDLPSRKRSGVLRFDCQTWNDARSEKKELSEKSPQAECTDSEQRPAGAHNVGVRSLVHSQGPAPFGVRCETIAIPLGHTWPLPPCERQIRGGISNL